MSGLQLNHLRCFVTVADELHFGKAAARLGIAQPALSQQIQRLERELGVPLFTRTSRRVHLTDAGRRFLPEARALLEQASRTRELMRNIAAGVSGHLAIGFVGSASLSHLPDIVVRFRERYPDVALTLTEMPSDQQTDELLERRIQVGCLRSGAVPTPLATTLLAREPLVLAMPASLGEDAPDPLPLASVAQAAFIMPPRHLGQRYHDDVTSACDRAGIEPRVVQEAIQMTTIVGLVAAGVGVALVPHSIEAVQRPGVVYRRLTDGEAFSELRLAWNPDALDPATGNFLQVAREQTFGAG